MLSACRRRVAEDERDEVRSKWACDGAAGRGRRDEVERAAEPHAVLPQARRRLLERVEMTAAAATAAGEHDERAVRRQSGFTARQCTGRSGQARETGYGRRRGRRRPETAELRAARRAGRAEPPAGPDARDQRPDRARAARRARSRARRTPPARATSTSSTPTSTCAARTSRAPSTDRLGYSPPWLVERLDEFGATGGALCAISGNPEPELFADLDGERVGKARMREVAEASLKLTDGLCNWTIVAFPNEGWAQTVFGEPDVERLWDGGRHGRPARRARSGRRPGASTSTRLAAARRVAERAAVRPPALPRAGHRPDDRPASRVRVADGARRVAGDQARREHADRGGLHDSRRTSHRRHRALDAAAADPGQHRARPRGALRGRPRGRGARRVRRGASCARTSRPTTAPRASARSRSSTATRASARPGSSSTTRCSTRTRRRTSRSARRSCRPSPGRPTSTAEERSERGVNHSSIHTDFMIGSNELEIDGVDAGRHRRADPAQRRLAALEPDVEVGAAAGYST